MRIIILSTSFNLGGAEKHGYFLADFFKNVKKFDVEYWAFKRGDGTLESLCKSKSVQTRIIGIPPRFGKWIYPIQSRKEALKFSKFKPDIIISFNVVANLYCSYVGPFTSARCIVWSQQNTNNLEMLRPVDTKVMKNNHCFISNSEHAINYLCNNFPVKRSHVFFVKNGFERIRKPMLGNDEWLNKLGIEEATFKVIKIAHVEERKDHLTLLKAWKIVVERLKINGHFPVLLLAGKLNHSVNELIRYSLQNNIYANVRFLSKVEDIFGILKAVDLSVMCSNNEGMPNSIVESFFAELPVVANDIPGNREVMGNANKRFIAKHKDPGDLADKILLFAGNKDLRKKIGLANLEYAKRHYSINNLGENTMFIIEKYLILNQRKRTIIFC